MTDRQLAACYVSTHLSIPQVFVFGDEVCDSIFKSTPIDAIPLSVQKYLEPLTDQQISQLLAKYRDPNFDGTTPVADMLSEFTTVDRTTLFLCLMTALHGKGKLNNGLSDQEILFLLEEQLGLELYASQVNWLTGEYKLTVAAAFYGAIQQRFTNIYQSVSIETLLSMGPDLKPGQEREDHVDRLTRNILDAKYDKNEHRLDWMLWIASVYLGAHSCQDKRFLDKSVLDNLYDPKLSTGFRLPGDLRRDLLERLGGNPIESAERLIQAYGAMSSECLNYTVDQFIRVSLQTPLDPVYTKLFKEIFS